LFYLEWANIDQAIDLFKNILSEIPVIISAVYFLALAYEDKKLDVKALEAFAKIPPEF